MEEIDVVTHSYGRACLNPHLIDRFYEVFLSSHPEIKPLFRHTDFTKQKQLLKTSVIMLLAHLEGKSAWTENLIQLAKRHSKKELNIHPSLYQYWIDSLITAVKEHDPQWTPDLERAWQKVLRAGVDFIVEHYDAP